MEKRIRYPIIALICTIEIVVGFLFWRFFQPSIIVLGIVGVLLFFIICWTAAAVWYGTMSPEEKAKEDEKQALRLKELEERRKEEEKKEKKKGLWTRFWDELDGTATRERLAERAEEGICDYCSGDIKDRYYTCTVCEEVFCSQRCYYGHERDVHDR